MRPLLLTMHAFGSFSEKETIDFRKLGSRSLFLIHGPTGSGKTTILDAICFALYGVTSGLDREAYFMRSDFSDETLPTEVSLTFSLGSEIYRVIRIPEQERAKLRGTGITKKAAAATLWKVNTKEPVDDEIVIADRWNRVTEKIVDLLGFRSDQFRQVVILPQGDFRRLLSASSQERQEILTILFKTGRFKLFEDELKDAAKYIKNKYEQLVAELQFYFKESSVNTLDELVILLDTIERDTKSLNNEYNIVKTEEKSILENIFHVKEINARFKELDEANKNYEQLKRQLTYFEQQIFNHKLLEKALFLEREWEYCTQIENEYHKLKEDLFHAREINDKVKLHKEKSESDLKIALEKISIRENFVDELGRFRQMEPKLSRLESLRSTIQDFRKKLSDLTSEKESKKDHLEKIRSSLNKIQDEIVRLRETALLLEIRKKRVLEIEKIISDKERVLILQKELQMILPKIENARNEHILLEKKINNCKSDIDSCDILRQKYYSATLAQSLVPGKPCPVCGSSEHPSPSLSDVYIPDEKELQSLKVNLKQLENEKEQVRNGIEQYQIKISKLQHEITFINKSLDFNDFDKQSSANDHLIKSKALVTESTDAANRLHKLSETKNRGENALIEAEKELEDIQNNLLIINVDLKSSETARKDIEAEIPPEFHALQSISIKIDEKELMIKELDISINKARKTFENCNEQFISSNTALQQISENEAELAMKANRSKNDLLKKLNENGFSDIDQFKALIQCKSSFSDQKNEIQNYYMSLHSAEERLQRATMKCEGQKIEDATVLEKSHTELQLRIDSLTKQISALNQKQQLLKSKKIAIQKLSDEIQTLEHQYSIAGRLHETATGNNPLRMTFERFILASLLDEVLFAGTKRLKIMSCGRFEMHRARTSTDLRTSGGLDLQIFDSYTGTSRPVSSLSGGESFLAALSLALGLADVVQSHSGGIRLETIFVDEGFGSLDAEALDLAFQALTNLGIGGRLVGIISHVSELKDRIDTRLEVIPNKKGSSTKFII